MTAPSPRRFDLLGGPGGYMTCLPVGDRRRIDRYRQYVTLARINRPLTPALAGYVQLWAVRRHGESV